MIEDVLILDLDDTLVPSASAYAEAMKVIGLSEDTPAFLEARRLSKKRILGAMVIADEGLAAKNLVPEGLTAATTSGFSTAAARHRAIYFKTYLEMQGQFTAKRLLEMTDAYQAEVVRIQAQAWRNLGRAQLIEQLKAKTQKLAVLTNETLLFQMKKLAAFDGSELFDLVLTSEETGTEKPDPKMFRECLARLGVTDPKAATMVGDSLTNDIQPARALGMKSILTVEFTTEFTGDFAKKSPQETRYELDVSPDYPILKKLSDLPALLQTM